MTEPMVETMQYVNSDESKSDSQTKDIDMNPTTTPSDSLADWTELCITTTSTLMMRLMNLINLTLIATQTLMSWRTGALNMVCQQNDMRLENMLNKDNIDSVISIDTAHTGN